METQKNYVLNNKMTLTGILLILVSFCVFMIPEMDWMQPGNELNFGLFFFNYGITIAYLIILIINGILKFKWRFFKDSLEYQILLLVLLMISAFSLNREINVFEKSVDWMCFYLVVQCCTMMLLCFRKQLPILVNYLLFFLLGSGLLLYLYFAVYLVPLYIISTVGAIFFGMSLHVFVPLLFVILIFRLLHRAVKENSFLIFPFIAGIFIPVVFVISFFIQWQGMQKQVNYILNESVANESDVQPWVKLSQNIERSMFFEKMIKTDLVYSTPDKNVFWGWRMPQMTFDEQKKHDPLVMMAVLFLGKPDLGEQEKIKLLETMYDSRHQALERLWSGDKLETVNVISNIKIFPQFRLAYTEKILSVRNRARKEKWRNQQEAIYTFHLPEGGVVTSLSLWINGKEEKGVLTSKSKADSAYKTIVGIEQRDPSVVHWQEGNKVSVRVFPCTPDENRRFKIGITTPLTYTDHKLIYENIYFDGPSGSKATESVQIKFDKTPGNILFPFDVTTISDKAFNAEKKYEAYWEIKFDETKLSNEYFSFGNRSFSIADYKPIAGMFIPDRIFLDLNKSWTIDEYTTVLKAFKNKNIFAIEEEIIKITDQNSVQIYEKAIKHNFSLFPFYKMNSKTHDLVITKCTPMSPDLSDLSGSSFAEELNSYLKTPGEIRIYNIGNTLSPYLKTLKDLHVLLYEQGSIAALSDLITKEQFGQSQENDSTVVISNAGILIKETKDSVSNGAPDHLQRLFSYGRIMSQTGSNYYNHDFLTEANIAEAKASYIVSPVSSLIVLESKQDYDRFGIEDNKNSLKNASMKSSGSVPEPQEWMLIILASSVVIFLTYKSYLEKRNANG